MPYKNNKELLKSTLSEHVSNCCNGKWGDVSTSEKGKCCNCFQSAERLNEAKQASVYAGEIKGSTRDWNHLHEWRDEDLPYRALDEQAPDTDKIEASSSAGEEFEQEPTGLNGTYEGNRLSDEVETHQHTSESSHHKPEKSH